MSCARAPPKSECWMRWVWGCFLFCQCEITFQTGEAVESGLTAFVGASTVLKFGVSGRIKGSDMTLWQNGFGIHVSLLGGFLS